MNVNIKMKMIRPSVIPEFFILKFLSDYLRSILVQQT